jgi:Delta7-sterol 5-desaturase
MSIFSAEAMLAFATDYAICCIILLGCYFGTGLVILQLNRRQAGAKIQDRETPSHLVRRDFRRSVLSFASIAMFVALGWWTNETLGLGMRVETMTVANTVLSFLGSMLLYDAWFYWAHRLIHTKLLYKPVHKWHHMTVTPVVWSVNSDTLLDNCFMQTYWLVLHFILPVAPAVVLAHKIYDQITSTIGHAGYEYGGRLAMPPSPFLSVTHHDQHHRFFQCNYGGCFSFWDRLMGTLHRDHDVEVRRNIERSAAADAAASARVGAGR